MALHERGRGRGGRRGSISDVAWDDADVAEDVGHVIHGTTLGKRMREEKGVVSSNIKVLHEILYVSEYYISSAAYIY